MIALSSVINRQIKSVYPEFGSEKCVNLFNTVITPHPILKPTTNSSTACTILWCHTDPLSMKHDNISWNPNHFVPIVERSSLVCMPTALSSVVISSSPGASSLSSSSQFREAFPDKKVLKVQSKIGFVKSKLPIMGNNYVHSEPSGPLDSNLSDNSFFQGSLKSLNDVSSYLKRCC
jgi:hypothetical protein